MRLNNLQALRGIACLFVLIYHVAEREVHTGVTILTPCRVSGFGGVDLFFVLSGFVITWVNTAALGDPTRLVGYVGRRLWRIYPIYWVSWLAAVPIYLFILNGGWHLAIGDIVRLLLLIPTAAPNAFIPQAWTLTYEVKFYIAFAAFFLLPRKLFLPVLALWATTIVAAYGTGRSLAWLTQPLVLEFLFGCGIACAVRVGSIGYGRTVLAVGIAGFAAGGVVQFTGAMDAANLMSRVVQFGVPSALIVYGAVAVERTRSWMLPRWMQTIGDASYSIYLVHLAIIEVGVKLLAGMSHALPAHLLWIAALAVPAVAIGFLMHFAVERPLQRLAARRPAADTAAPLRRAA